MTRQLVIAAVLCALIFVVNFTVFHHSMNLSFLSVLASLALGEGLYQLGKRYGSWP